MIKTNTLFILGAGASVPFGYPTGNDLRDEILAIMDYYEDDIDHGDDIDNNDIIDAYTKWYLQKNKNMFVSNSLNIFKEKFEGSSDYSIDAFLEHRPEFMDLGKIYIARILISFEVDKKLRSIKDNRYIHLFDRMKTSFGELGKNNISFITFNYDRSLEYFLSKAIEDKFTKSPKESAEMMKNFPIVHLYGQLDPLPWQEKNGREYSATKNLTHHLMAAPENIKLISNERDIDKSPEFKEAYKLIEEAKRIFFLGFSFDETNLGRLKIELMRSKLVQATAQGLKGAKRTWIENYFRSRCNTNINLVQTDALSLLEDHLEIE
jgi:hypothetical protein